MVITKDNSNHTNVGQSGKKAVLMLRASNNVTEVTSAQWGALDNTNAPFL